VKKFLCFFLFFQCIYSAFATNRIATAEDRAIYGEFITPGDLIIDSPTSINGDKKEVIYFFMPKNWPGLREGATIWLDGDKLGFLHIIKFSNSATITPWHINSAKIKNIPNTQVQAASFVCNGLKYVELNGESSAYPGLSEWPESRKFLTGAFGFHIIHKMTGGHGIDVSVPDHGTIKLKGFEVQFGFSGVRINGGNHDVTVDSITINNFYIHDTGDGEGQYLGATHKPPLAKLKNLVIYDGVIARTAAEALQLQHLAGGANVHNVTIRNADARWVNEFMAGQDTGLQWSVDAGENKMHHIIVDGFASVGLVPFSSDQVPGGGVSKVSNILFNDGMDTGMYLHNSGRFGIHWMFDSIYYRAFNNCYYEITGRKNRPFFISKKNGTDQYTFSNIFHDDSKPAVFENKNSVTAGKTIKKELPRLHYINSGFSEPAHKIRQWHEYYGGYFPASMGKNKLKTKWKAGDIAIETKDTYAFYKCLTDHESSTLRPPESEFFIKLTWDGNGIRSDQPEWNATTRQSDFPPDDLRLKEDTYWKKLNFGFNTRSQAQALTNKD
jgi:hypothetical protein